MTNEQKTQMDSESLYEYTQTEGWKTVKGIYERMVRELNDIRNIPKELTGEDKLREVELRTSAASLFEHLLNEINSKVDVYTKNNDAINTIVKGDRKSVV